MSHWKSGWTCVAAVLAFVWGHEVGADDKGCAEERAAYESLKEQHEKLQVEYRQEQTWMMIPVPFSALGKSPECKDLPRRYTALAKQVENLVQQIDKREEKREEARSREEQQEEARRVREEKFISDGQDDAIKLQNAAQDKLVKYLGEDTILSATERLDTTVSHIESLHRLSNSLLGPLPAEFEAEHQPIPVPWSPRQQRRTQSRTDPEVVQ